MIDRKTFFAAVRAKPFPNWMTQSQVNGIDNILDEWERRNLTDVRWLAYMLATTFHETGRAMQPIREGGGEAYLRSKDYYPWVGEGLVQVTWEANARKFGATKPGDCLSWPVALRALFDGMINGVFTGHALRDFFGPQANDPVNARRIINGTDKADMIAGYHRDFLAAIIEGQSAADPPLAPSALTPGPRVTTPVAAAPPSFWSRVKALL